MNVIRPCLACGAENPADASACSRCGERLRVHAAAVPPVTAKRPATQRRGGVVGGVALLAVVTAAGAWWWWQRVPASRVVEPSLRWSDPSAVAAWATDYLTTESLPPTALRAEVVPADPEPRRAFVTEHPAEQPLPLVVRGVARLLVKARAEGAASAAHLAVVKREGALWALPVGEASELATSPAALARWLGLTEEELGLEPPAPVAAAGTEVVATLSSGPAPPEVAEAPAETTAPAPTGDAPEASSAPVAPTAPQATPPAAASAPATASAPAATAASSASAPAAATADGASAPASPALPARVARGNGAVPSKAAGGQAGVPLFRLQVAAGARRALTLRSLTLKAKGTLADVEGIAWVDLSRETDPSGAGRGKATRVGSRESFTDDDGTVTFSGLDLQFGEDSKPLSLLVTADLEADLVGGTIELSLPDVASVVVEDADARPVPITGTPVRGVRITVEGTIPPDEEQERLDRLAEAGPDAVDPNLERLQQEAERQREAARASGASGAAPSGPTVDRGRGAGSSGPAAP